MQGDFPTDPASQNCPLMHLGQFYLDDMDDDVTMSALRLLVKDLLLLFQAVNEGVINVLGGVHFSGVLLKQTHPLNRALLRNVPQRRSNGFENLQALLHPD